MDHQQAAPRQRPHRGSRQPRWPPGGREHSHLGRGAAVGTEPNTATGKPCATCCAQRRRCSCLRAPGGVPLSPSFASSPPRPWQGPASGSTGRPPDSPAAARIFALTCDLPSVRCLKAARRTAMLARWVVAVILPRRLAMAERLSRSTATQSASCCPSRDDDPPAPWSPAASTALACAVKSLSCRLLSSAALVGRRGGLN